MKIVKMEAHAQQQTRVIVAVLATREIFVKQVGPCNVLALRPNKKVFDWRNPIYHNSENIVHDIAPFVNNIIVTQFYTKDLSGRDVLLRKWKLNGETKEPNYA